MNVRWLPLIFAVGACSHTPEEPSRPAISAEPRPITKPQTQCPRDPGGAPMLPTHTLSVRESGVKFVCEFVYQPADTERGLMYRTEMESDHGMLFKLRRKVQRFWMHNTCLSLDMLFLDDDGTVLGIVDNVPPLNDESRGIGQPSTYVLELNAGAAAKYGVTVGQHLELPSSIRDLEPPAY